MRVNRTPQGILMHGDFQGSTPTECVRCLTNFIQPLHTTFDEMYAFNERSITESELLVPEDGNIDLEPIVREYLLIEMPISPICSPDCKGLCLICGQNLNERECEHSSSETQQEFS